MLTADITAASFSKFQRLLRELRAPAFGWQMHDANDRLVIFSERIESLRWLERQLAQDLKLKANQLAILHGQMTDTDQQELVERFGRLDDCHDWMLLECLEFGLEAVLRAVCLIGNDNDVVPLGQNREHVPVFAWDAHDGGFGVVLQGAFETPASLRSGQCIDDFDGACEQHRGPLIERPDEGSARAVGPSRRSGEMFGAKSTLRIRVAVVSHDRTDGTRDADSRLVGDQGCLAVDRSGRGHR